MTADDEDELDTAFELLADRRRRAVVTMLRAAPRGVLELPALVDAVATECEGDADALASTLHHHHLPKLDDAGVVEFDREEGVVSYDSHPLVERCLDVAQSYRSDQWVRRSSKSE
jgi:DNA-binding transcriptional ArsR family regulator